MSVTLGIVLWYFSRPKNSPMNLLCFYPHLFNFRFISNQHQWHLRTQPESLPSLGATLGWTVRVFLCECVFRLVSGKREHSVHHTTGQEVMVWLRELGTEIDVYLYSSKTRSPALNIFSYTPPPLPLSVLLPFVLSISLSGINLSPSLSGLLPLSL